MILGSNVHNTGAAVFLLFTVGIPLAWIIYLAVSGKHEQPRQPRKMKSHDIPLRDMRDERAEYIENRIEHKDRGYY